MDVSWDHYRTFIAVLRTGSLSGAARSIGLTQPTAGRHIDAMESHFGTLFTRSQAGFSPTELGERLRTYAETLENDVSALLREASLKKELHSGTVRVTASEIVGSEILPELFASLREKYPRIAIELVLSDETENLLTRQADIAIRMFDPEQKALIAKRLGVIEVGLHAQKKYLEKWGRPMRVEELQKHSLIGYDTQSEFVREVEKKIGLFPRGQFSLRTDSNVAQLAAIRAGYGIGFCQLGLGKRDKNLERVLPNQLSFKMPIWVVMHENLKLNPVCVAVFNHLRDELMPLLA